MEGVYIIQIFTLECVRAGLYDKRWPIIRRVMEKTPCTAKLANYALERLIAIGDIYYHMGRYKVKEGDLKVYEYAPWKSYL